MRFASLAAVAALPALVSAGVPRAYGSHGHVSQSFTRVTTTTSVTAEHTTSESARTKHATSDWVTSEPATSASTKTKHATSVSVVSEPSTSASTKSKHTTLSSAISKPITASSVYSSITSPTPQVVLPGNWTTALCNTTIVDATQSPQTRWNAAGGPDALTAVVNAWLSQGAASNLNFPEFNLMGSFSSLFAPQVEDGTEAIKILIDAIVMISAIASSYAWGFAFIEAGIVAKEFSSISKDITNAAVNSFALAATKDSLKSPANALGTQNTLSAALGAFFEEWESMESNYVKTLFDGSNDADSIATLQKLIGTGDMLVLPSTLDLSKLTGQAEKILYGQLIPAAWSVGPQNLHPVILRKASACSTSYDQSMLQYMSQDTLVGGYVCYNGDAFYVVNAQVSVGGDNPTFSFTGLPGGTHSALNGQSWGGVILEDMVQSSYDAYALNGHQNGYVMPSVSSVVDGKGTEGDIVFQNGIRTPGFFNLPICDDIPTAVSNTISSSPSGKYWPCTNPSGYNPSGTNLHVNYGCVTINNTPKCASGSVNIVDQGGATISASIYAQFDGNDKTDYMVVPGCVLQASWPRNYGDVYFGQDNCLYDSTGTKINNQCCTAETTQSVVNPYYG